MKCKCRWTRCQGHCSRSTRGDLGRERLAILVAEEVAGKLGEGALVDVALEIDHRLERHPIVVPAPGVELGSFRGAQAHIALTADQPQQEPDLLLSPVVAAPIPLEPPRRHFVAQPVSRPPQDLYMGGQQAHFFSQLPVHRLHRRFADFYSALRELPGVLFDALAPENLVAPVAENDADVRPIAVSIEHTQSSKKSVRAHSFIKRRRFEAAPAPRKAGQKTSSRMWRLAWYWRYARFPILSRNTQRSPFRRGAGQSQADGPRGNDSPSRRGYLHLDAARPPGRPQGRGDRARGNEPRRSDRGVHAGGAACGAVARVGTLAEVRAGAAALEGPP